MAEKATKISVGMRLRQMATKAQYGAEISAVRENEKAKAASAAKA